MTYEELIEELRKLYEKGKEILCVELLEKGLYKIQYRDDKNDTILTAERYERIINN